MLLIRLLIIYFCIQIVSTQFTFKYYLMLIINNNLKIKFISFKYHMQYFNLFNGYRICIKSNFVTIFIFHIYHCLVIF